VCAVLISCKGIDSVGVCGSSGIFFIIADDVFYALMPDGAFAWRYALDWAVWSYCFVLA
jgi:hypothetical protein